LRDIQALLSVIFNFSIISKHVFFFNRKINHIQKVSTSSSWSNKAEEAKQKEEKSEKPVRLFASVCIERMPIITCDMNDIEKRYSDLINQINVKKSLLSDHELRHLKDL
jgi:hypothetical protein